VGLWVDLFKEIIMKLYLKILVLVCVFISGCNNSNEDEITYSIIGLWERESLTISTSEEPTLSNTIMSDSTNYDFIQFNPDMSYSNYGFNIEDYSSAGEYQLSNDTLILFMQDSSSSDLNNINLLYELNDNNLILRQSIVDSSGTMPLTMNIEQLYLKVD
jgi:flagellar assembly factor FliW